MTIKTPKMILNRRSCAAGPLAAFLLAYGVTLSPLVSGPALGQVGGQEQLSVPDTLYGSTVGDKADTAEMIDTLGTGDLSGNLPHDIPADVSVDIPVDVSAVPGHLAMLQGMDKITGRVQPIPVAVGGTVHFGTLEIRVLRCYKRPPVEPPETAALVEIFDIREGKAGRPQAMTPVPASGSQPESNPAPGEDTRLPLFRGWMFASSPALSALEHPVYDIWVTDCKNKSSAASDN